MRELTLETVLATIKASGNLEDRVRFALHRRH